MRIGIFGGSFNPIHNGHVELIRGIVSELYLDKIFIMPSFLPPHKNVDCFISPEDRIEMCRIAIEAIDSAEVCDIEIKRGGKSYTYRTLEELHKIYPNDEFFLIMGADMFLSVETWKNPEIIFNLATICGVPRKGTADAEKLRSHEFFLHTLGAKTCILKLSLPEISSTEIRKAISNGELIDNFVPKGVEKYIRERKLYF